MKGKNKKYKKRDKNFENESHKAKKKYGQNFLNDSNLSDEILMWQILTKKRKFWKLGQD